MREIKFRGKRLDNGEWVHGDLHIRTPFPHIHSEIDYSRVKIDPHTVGQFTGLHDKNGKEIYEGDIVRYDMGGECEVSYCIGGGFAGFDLSPAFHDEHQLTDVEVIGNIHDNPELLKTE